MKKTVLALLMFVLFLTAAEYGKEGAKEAGGFIGFGTYSHNNEGDTRHGQVDITPLFNMFLVDNVYLGPRLHINSFDKMTTFGAGASIGYAFLPDINLIPFAEGGLEFIYSEYVDKAGMAIPINGGVKLPVVENVLVGITAGSYIKFINKNPGADFTFGVGLTMTF